MKELQTNNINIISTFIIAVIFFISCIIADKNEYVIHQFEKIQLSSKFYAEGAGIGDLNGDDRLDVICGPFLYEGPDFKNRRIFYEPVEFETTVYSDNFVVEIVDINGNGLNDILVVGFPGEATHWYENPGNSDGLWARHLIHPKVENESPWFYDLNRDGNLELIFHTDGYLGYATKHSVDPTKPWTFTPISKQWDWGKFTHGLGIGDLDGDGLEDIIKKEGWWENPGLDKLDTRWTYHEVDFGVDFRGGAQMPVYDMDGDGLNDVITSLNAHGWGIVWYRQVRNGEDIQFVKNLVMGEQPADNPYGVRFSAPHAIEMVDLDKDGLNDFVSGKRLGPGSDPDKEAPAVIYWFKLKQEDNGDVGYVPYLIDDDSGIGTQFKTGDLTGNGYPDIVTCNKKGAYVFLNSPEKVSRDVWQAAQPVRIE